MLLYMAMMQPFKYLFCNNIFSIKNDYQFKLFENLIFLYEYFSSQIPLFNNSLNNPFKLSTFLLSAVIWPLYLKVLRQTFLLEKIGKLTEGKSLDANIQLVYNNAKLAAKIAVAFAKERKKYNFWFCPNKDFS